VRLRDIIKDRWRKSKKQRTSLYAAHVAAKSQAPTTRLAPGPPHCGSDDVETEQPYRSPWVTVECGNCGEESEVDADPVNPAAERY
jgi:hypothetical protein